VLNGSKSFTTLADRADVFMVLARTGEGAKKTDGVSVLLVPRPPRGISISRIETLGQRPLGTFQVHYDDVFVPDDMVLGEPGDGWRCLTSTLNQERVMIAAMCTGTIRGVIERAVEYANHRETFGRTIAHYQAVQHAIATMEMGRQASRLLTYNAAALLDSGADAPLECSIAKCFASEQCSSAADRAIQVMGGAGYSTDHDVERFWRDTRIMQIAPIANEMVRNYVAEHLGMPRSF
jgi:acyl-CoA dehydrogenase